MVITVCEFCKRPFKAYEGRGKYCSRSCFYRGRKKPQETQCAICGKSFVVFPYLLRKGYGKYCSQECAGIGHRTTEQRTCQFCGKLFEAQPNVIKKGKAKYCSQVCGARAGIAPPITRFLGHIHIMPGPNGCWFWDGSHLTSGYGHFLINNKQVLASRFSYEYFRDLLKPNYLAAHTCDRPPCVNPAHLFTGEDYENIHDAIDKRRIPRIKLTVNKVKEILSRPYENTSVLAAEYNVSYKTIHAIRLHKAWRKVSLTS